MWSRQGRWTPLNPADKAGKTVGTFGATRIWAAQREIAPAFVFLAAPVARRFITGKILPIIGGYSGG
jgi:NAD(P)-dependent dehydrogenase (short-subunit alcohol dehydrogenase family)